MARIDEQRIETMRGNRMSPKPLVSRQSAMPEVLRRCRRFVAALVRHPSEIRYVPVLISAYVRYGKAIKETIPWMPLRAIQWVENQITPSTVIFEYGSGTSTLRWARSARKVVSIEHSQLWQEKIRAAVEREGLSNCEVVLALPDQFRDETSVDPSNPETYASARSNNSFRCYVHQIDRFPDNSLDMIFIDGRARPASLWHSLAKLKPGGFVIFDDAYRPRYRRSLEHVMDWEKVDLSGVKYDGKFQTTIAWRKPD